MPGETLVTRSHTLNAGELRSVVEHDGDDCETVFHVDRVDDEFAEVGCA